MTRSDSPTRLVKFDLDDVHLEGLKKAGKILGHKSRSETLRWLTLNAAKFADMKMQQVKEQISNS